MTPHTESSAATPAGLTTAPTAGPDRFTRVALGTIAVCLVALTLDTVGAPGASEAVASPKADEGKTGLVSAGAQRKEISGKLDRLSASIQKIETRLAEGVEVRISGLESD